MDTTQRHACLLRAFEPSVGREVQLGKIVPVRFQVSGEMWCYVNNVNAKFEKVDAFGVARPVIQLMKDWDVQGVLYYWGSLIYNIKLETIGQFTPWTPGKRPPYYQIPVRAWAIARAGVVVNVPRTDEILTLRWDEANATFAQPAAQQLAML